MSSSLSSMNMDRVKDLRGRVTDMVRQSLLASSILMGDELSLFKAMRGVSSGVTAASLAAKCSVDLRHVQEWLLSMTAFNIVQRLESESESESKSKSQAEPLFVFPEEYAAVLIDEATLMSGIGMLQYGVGAVMSHEALVSGFKSGSGIRVCDMDARCSPGIRRWFRTVYDALLINEWLPKLHPDHLAKLEKGGRFADVGCGHGHTVLLLARRFPKSTFIGYDYDAESIEVATAAGAEAKLTNVEFKVATGIEYGSEYGSSCVFDGVFFMIAFHDFSNPERTAIHTRRILTSDGFVFSAEPYAGATTAETLAHPLGSLFTLISQHYCMAVSKAHAEAGSRVMGAVFLTPEYHAIWVAEAGFSECNLLPVANSPNHRVFEINVAKKR